MTTKTKALAVPPAVTKQVSTNVLKAQELKITDAESMKEATIFLSTINKIADSITKEKEKITKPLNEALKAERGRWKPIETQLEEAIGLVRGKMTKYQTEALAKQREEEAKIVNRVGEGKGKLSAETAVKRLEGLDTPAETVSTEAGAVQFRTVKKFEVMDITMVPHDFLEVNETKVREAMKAGTELPGIRYYEEQVPYNTR